jgi:hypothetical protein
MRCDAMLAAGYVIVREEPLLGPSRRPVALWLVGDAWNGPAVAPLSELEFG